ncbi:MAG: hypothetical protein AAFY09_15735, partial [Pseudomonadota bacterium]
MLDYGKIREKLLADTRRLLAKKNKALGLFAEHLFEHALAEDLCQYSSEELATFATDTREVMQTRKRGKPLVAFHERTIGLGENERSITTIDIINDNMPFLIDSILPELRNLGHEIYFIVHPIFVTDREKDGTLTSDPVRYKTTEAGDGEKESLIHLHVERLSAS